ncbi:Homeobox-leucine zipper protein HAT14 [Acorus calamus]|uniref:Homeobox-leucine zipper protein HAT14 n=1 Tax=Acorus calamus TaxID=4465 RepID=A0AAV9DLJ3_ACOCL|nr:Homeobox-leucine zipper protein HAT14 [Acorus calamus]
MRIRLDSKDSGSPNMGLSIGGGGRDEEKDEVRVSVDRPIQLDLLPFAPVPRSQVSSSSSSQMGLQWLNNGNSERGFDVNRPPEEAVEESSPSAGSSFPMEFSFTAAAAAADGEAAEAARASSRASDEDEMGSTRKKLRLSKEQSAFLEESFKEHNTLNPKQKLVLAKQLNLRPRQVEVWFQNRRARTKLKQTEVDCEYLKRCCETLTEENRRLQKELQELRALKTTHPYYMQFPATTLTMCPSCERVATSTTSSAAAAAPPAGAPPQAKPLFDAFKTRQPNNKSTAS